MRKRRVLAIAVGLTTIAGACGWPMARFGPEHTTSSPDTSISRAAVSSGSLVPRWKAIFQTESELSSVVVANGVAYVGSGNGRVYAFDAAGSVNCSGSPTMCEPLWTATTGGRASDPALANGVLFVGSIDGTLHAFDAAGSTNCSGSPKTCEPLWTARTGGRLFDSPTPANGFVYVGSDDGLLSAFDAAGETSCSGNPKTCQPLWTALVGSSITDPAVANGVAYVSSSDDRLYAFDAAGITNCSGSPTVCEPLWTAATGGPLETSPAVANGVVYVSSSDRNLSAFDAAGSAGCSGTPKTCEPLWTAPTAGIPSYPAVAGGTVFVGSSGSPNGGLYAFDANGQTNCSGSPKTCTPLWTWTSATASNAAEPAVANGVVYLVDGLLRAFDAAGSANCSGSPKTCAPLWSFTAPPVEPPSFVELHSIPAVAARMVYVDSGDHPFGTELIALGLETVRPTTSILVPSAGAIVSGTTVLDASASDNVAVSKVEFRLSGAGFHDTLIGPATKTQFGWIAEWDTASVANGDYTLRSVAFDPAGNKGTSASVSVTVQN